MSAAAKDTAVFARTAQDADWYRVTDWMTFRKAGDLYATLRDPFQPGGLPCEVGHWEDRDHRDVAGREPVAFLAVRSFRELRDAGTRVLARGEDILAQPPGFVRLDRGDRQDLLHRARISGCLDDGMDTAVTILLERTDTEHLDAATVSDYAWSLARFAFPQEARYA